MLTCEYFEQEIDDILSRKSLSCNELEVLKDLLVTKYFLGKEMSATSKMSEETAREWVSKMENTDGTTGAHWTIDATTAVRDKLGLKHICKYEFWAVMNSLYSDYGKTLAKTNATPEIYGELARDWIEDDDAVKAKASAYYRYVVAHD
jgi:hypothetical protein